MRPPAPYASSLYGRLVDLRASVEASWRGLGTGEANDMLAALEARIADLETDGPGSAWTQLDEVWWRAAVRGVPVRLDPAVRSWLETALELAGVAMPAGFEA